MSGAAEINFMIKTVTIYTMYFVINAVSTNTAIF